MSSRDRLCPTFPSVVTIKEAWTPSTPGTDTRIAQLVALVHAQSQRRTGRTPTYLPMEVSEWRRRMRTPSVPSRLTVTTTGVEGGAVRFGGGRGDDAAGWAAGCMTRKRCERLRPRPPR